MSRHRLSTVEHLQTKRGVLEGFLHLSGPEHAQVAALLGAAAVAELGGQGLEGRLLRDYLGPAGMTS